MTGLTGQCDFEVRERGEGKAAGRSVFTTDYADGADDGKEG